MTVIAKLDQSASWNAITNTSGFPDLINPPTTLQGQTIVPSGSPSDLTYYVSFTTSDGIPITGESQDPTFGASSTLYQLNSFSFDIQNTTSIGSATSGAGAGKVTPNPLNLVLSQPSLMPRLLQTVASGGHFTSVDVLGYRQDGTQATDDTFKLVAPTDFSTDSTGLTSLALEYGGLKITTTPPAGTTGSPITGGWNIVTNSSDATVATASPAVLLADAGPTPPQGKTVVPAVSPDLTYYVRFTLDTNTGPLDGSTLYQLENFSFDVKNALTIGSSTGGAGTGKAVFNPLELVLDQSSLTPALFQELAAGTLFKQVDVLGYRQDGTLATDDSFGLAVDKNLSTNDQGNTDISLDYGRLSIQTYSDLDIGTFTAATPAKVEQGQTTVVGSVTLGFSGETLALTQSAGIGALSLGQISNGVQQIIYTAPGSITASGTDTVAYTISDQFGDTVATPSTSVQLDAGPTIAPATPDVVEKGQTTVIATVTPGLAGDTLTVTQTAGSGTLSLGAVSGGVQQVIYTAPGTINASAVDSVAYKISDQYNDATATGSSNVQLDAGPSIASVTPSLVENGQTTEIGTVMPGLVGDTLTLQQTGGTGSLAMQLVNGVEQVIYTAPAAIAAGAQDMVSYKITDQHQDAAATGSSIVPVAPAGDSVHVGTAGGSVSVGNGNSAIDGRAGNETIAAGNGTDVIFGGLNDTITAGNGTDSIYSGANNSIVAGNGNDAVTAGDNSSIKLGNGNDTASAGANGSVNLGNGNNTVAVGANGTIKLGNGNDKVTAGDNGSVNLGNGNDTVTAGANSTIMVGNGNDNIFAGANNLISIGRGHDTVAFGESPNPIAIGNETINGFNPAQDIMQFNPALLRNYSAWVITQVGANTVIQIDPTDSVTLNHVTAAALSSNNFRFS